MIFFDIIRLLGIVIRESLSVRREVKVNRIYPAKTRDAERKFNYGLKLLHGFMKGSRQKVRQRRISLCSTWEKWRFRPTAETDEYWIGALRGVGRAFGRLPILSKMSGGL